MEDIQRRGIYTDLIRTMVGRNHRIFVVSCRQRRSGRPTEVCELGSISSLKVRTGNITQTGLIEKGLTTLTIEGVYWAAIKKFFRHIKFDLVMYSTPPITFENLVKRLKKKHNAKTYLILKDIFPQNAVDMGFMKKGNLMWRYFRRRERRLYDVSDKIGCMSPANKAYILKHNPNISPDKLEIFPNSIIPLPKSKRVRGPDVLGKYNIPDESVLFVYGGNLGKPQGIDFLLEVVDHFHVVDNAFLLIVGSGTEYTRIEKHIKAVKPTNVLLHNYLPKDEYDKLMGSADVGLIFLDRRFTIPNFPSRLTAYMEASLPVLAATDVNTDLKDVLKESRSGFWCESGDLESFLGYAKQLARDPSLRSEMGKSGREYLENNYDVRQTVDVILKHF